METIRKRTVKALAAVFFLLAVAIAVHQYVYWGTPFEVADVHHELFIVTFAFAGAVLLFVSRGRRKK